MESLGGRLKAQSSDGDTVASDNGEATRSQATIPSWIQHSLPSVAFLVLLCGATILLRGPDMLLNMPWNPDEAELLAQGRRAQDALFPPYADFTTSTNTLLWPMFLGGLGALGIPLTFITAHILAALAYIFMSWSLFLLVKSRLGWRTAYLVTLPSSLWILSLTGDFLSLSSELLPITLIVLALLNFALPSRPPGLLRFFASTALLGLAFWAKPQTSLIAGCVALGMGLSLAMLIREGNKHARLTIQKITVSGLMGFLTPTLLILLVLVATGTYVNFVQETVMLHFSYLSERETFAGQSPNLLIRPSYAAEFIIGFAPAFLWALAVFAVWSGSSLARARTIPRSQALLWLLPLLGACATLTLAFPIFDHYANILFVAALTSASLVIVTESWSERGTGNVLRAPFTVLMAFGTALVIIAMSILPRILDNALTWRDGNVRFASQDVTSESLNAVCPPDSEVVVWGWASELYIWFDWNPATRYVNSWQFGSLPNDAWLRERLSQEVRSNRPDCIVDANREGFFGSHLREKGDFMDVMTEVDDLMRECYSQSEEQLSDQRFVGVWRKAEEC